jgi:hypothetical protein
VRDIAGHAQLHREGAAIRCFSLSHSLNSLNDLNSLNSLDRLNSWNDLNDLKNI